MNLPDTGVHCRGRPRGDRRVLLATFLIPVSAILLGILFLDETLQLRHLAGMGLIGIGLAAINGRPWRALRRGRSRTGPEAG